MITDRTISKINDIDIIEIARKYSPVQIKKAGANYKTICPFHSDKTPSLMLNSRMNIAKCFACGESANGIGLLMEWQGLSFPDAVKTIANDFSIEIEETGTKDKKEDKQKRMDRESIAIVLQWAADWYHRQLLTRLDEPDNKFTGYTCNLDYSNIQNSGKTEIAEIDYIKNRFSIEEIKTHYLGYATRGWSNLVNAAKKAGLKEDYLLKSGVMKIRENQKNEYKGDYFVFRPLIFPVWNRSGKISGFAARQMPWLKNDYPKYINSPDTELYKKDEILYGLNRDTLRSIRKQDRIYIVEGHTDKITIHSHGLKNSAATSGTSLTDEQAKLIRRLTKNAVLVFDGDKAGRKATERNGEKLLKAGCNVTVLNLPEGYDPDSYVKEGGDLRELEKSEEKEYILDIAEKLLSQADNIQKKKEAKQTVAERLLLLPKLEREAYIDKLQGKKNISKKDWKTELNAASIRLRNRGLNMSNENEIKPDNSSENKKRHRFYTAKKDKSGKFNGLKVDLREFLLLLKSTEEFSFEINKRKYTSYFGFFTYTTDHSEEDFIFVQLREGRIKRVSVNFIKRAFMQYVKRLNPIEINGYDKEGNEWIRIITNRDVEELILEKVETLFNEKRLLLYPDKEINIIQDKINEHYTFFRNCYVISNAKGIEIKEYTELKGGFVWEDMVLERDFRKPDDKKSVFEKFTHDISGNTWNLESDKPTLKDKKRYKAMLVSGGYSLHNYTDMKRKAVILTQGRISEDSSEGREGKTLFVQALGRYMMNRYPEESKTYIYVPGKDYDKKNKHKWQRMDRNTTMVLLDDPAWLNFEDFYNIAENSFPVSQMYSDEIHVKSRLFITTNKPIDRDSGSSKDRSCVIELNSIYDSNYSPIQKYQHYFFRDWDEKEWDRFTFYVLAKMLPAYFRNECELVEPPTHNLHRNELLQKGRRYTGSVEVIYWLDFLARGNEGEKPYLNEEEWYSAKDLRNKLTESLEMYRDNKKLKNNFSKVVEAYFEKEGISYEKARDANGTKWKITEGLPEPETVEDEKIKEYFEGMPVPGEDSEQWEVMAKEFNMLNKINLTTEQFKNISQETMQEEVPF